MTDDRDVWVLVNKVRDASDGIFTDDEKLRMHDLVTRLKTRKTISLADLMWLKSMDDALAGISAMTKTFRPRRGR